MIDITLSKAKYRRPDFRIERRTGLDPAEGTRVWLASNGGMYKGRDVSNGPIKTKKYSKRVNKLRCRRRVYLGDIAR